MDVVVISFSIIYLLRWSAEFGTSKNGSPELHVMLAEYIYSESPETVTCYSLLADNDVDTFKAHFYHH
jgi:hypothetical protein